jgi:hypothetical protein
MQVSGKLYFNELLPIVNIQENIQKNINILMEKYINSIITQPKNKDDHLTTLIDTFMNNPDYSLINEFTRYYLLFICYYLYLSDSNILYNKTPISKIVIKNLKTFTSHIDIFLKSKFDNIQLFLLFNLQFILYKNNKIFTKNRLCNIICYNIGFDNENISTYIFNKLLSINYYYINPNLYNIYSVEHVENMEQCLKTGYSVRFIHKKNKKKEEFNEIQYNNITGRLKNFTKKYNNNNAVEKYNELLNIYIKSIEDIQKTPIIEFKKSNISEIKQYEIKFNNCLIVIDHSNINRNYGGSIKKKLIDKDYRKKTYDNYLKYIESEKHENNLCSHENLNDEYLIKYLDNTYSKISTNNKKFFSSSLYIHNFDSKSEFINGKFGTYLKNKYDGYVEFNTIENTKEDYVDDIIHQLLINDTLDNINIVENLPSIKEYEFVNHYEDDVEHIPEIMDSSIKSSDLENICVVLSGDGNNNKCRLSNNVLAIEYKLKQDYIVHVYGWDVSKNIFDIKHSHLKKDNLKIFSLYYIPEIFNTCEDRMILNAKLG